MSFGWETQPTWDFVGRRPPGSDPHGRAVRVRSREWQRTEASYGARDTDWIVVAAVAMTDRPLGAQIDAVLERLHAHGRGSAGGAIREVLDEYADALTADMRSTAFRETDRGAEILILGSGRISLISVDFDESIVGFETPRLARRSRFTGDHGPEDS